MGDEAFSGARFGTGDALVGDDMDFSFLSFLSFFLFLASTGVVEAEDASGAAAAGGGVDLAGGGAGVTGFEAVWFGRGEVLVDGVGATRR